MFSLPPNAIEKYDKLQLQIYNEGEIEKEIQCQIQVPLHHSLASMIANLRRLTISFGPSNHLRYVSLIKFNSASQAYPSQHQFPNPNSIESLSKPQLRALIFEQYKQGKFFNLVKNVIALPAVLLTACQNIATPLPGNSHDSAESRSFIDTISRRFSIEGMGRELCENGFDIEACCVPMIPTKGGESLVLPNLKLKVLIEAIRMALEVVYDERFVTFSYGGRVGMGRHTAIRYLKNSVQNPTWWFNVNFDCQKFDNQHVNKLCLFIGEKIDDDILTGIIKRLFQCQVVQIELSGFYFGRGFPQESGLNPILINVYFNGFDKEIQEMRLQKEKENPKFHSNQLDSEDSIFYKPVKINAVRYLDEILLITSGSKMLTMDMKNWILNYLEEQLELKVNKVKTAIHSAVSEKIDFIGMELRAVTPSVLHPPMSEKVIRARKKYLRQKEVRAQELRNARERNRKKLGMKIFSHVFKKTKQSAGFKIEYEIDDEVRMIFETWAKEVMHEFFTSLEEHGNWHKMLSAGNFLSLRHIRDQLPQELVDAYDNFQEQVDKYLNPAKARKLLAEKEWKEEEEEKQKYANATVEDLSRLCMKVDAPIELIRKTVKLAGFTNHMGRPRPISLLTTLEDDNIIKWYAGIGRRWLDFFCCCHNFKVVKTIVTYHLRFSCILTLAEKHESTKLETIKHFTKDLKLSDESGTEELHFPTEREVKMMGDKNLSDPKPVDGALGLILIRLATDEPLCSCAAHFCDSTDTVVYRVRLLHKHLNVNPSDERKWVKGMGTIHGSLHLKCLPLCADHVHDLYMGRITLQNIDCTSYMDVD